MDCEIFMRRTQNYVSSRTLASNRPIITTIERFVLKLSDIINFYDVIINNNYMVSFSLHGLWCLFYLFWGVLRPTREFFTHMETLPLSVNEGLQILTYTWHSRPLSSERSLVCHTYCATGHPFIKVISGDPWHSHLLPSVW